MRQDNLIGYADLERLGWSNYLIDDYLGLKREVVAQQGTDTDPNGIYEANLNGFYVDTATPQLWFNPVTGATTGWIAL
jgi:hypothetical protein